MFFKTCLLLFATICCGWRIILANTDQPPNLVVILADDLGFDDVSFRGAKQFLTPNIDALAFHGKIINNMYASPLCTPSRAALLTGLYSIHTGTQHYVLHNEEPWGILQNFTNMAEILQEQGYSTNLIGKWHLGMARKEYAPTQKGFDNFYGYLGGFIGYYDRRSKMPSNYSLGYDFRRNLDLECVPEGSYATDLFTDEAVKVIAEHNAEQPLFLMVSHLAPHAGNDDNKPLAAPLEVIEKFNYISDKNKRIFAAMVTKLDESLGSIIKALDNRNLLKNSIIIFCSDNGAPTQGVFHNGGSNWPFRGQKNSPWEGAVRVPAVIWSPWLKNRSSIYQPTMHISDVLPTFAAAARISLSSYNLKSDGINHWPDLVASVPNFSADVLKKREIVHMLDEIDQISSFMLGQFKYIKGTRLNGSIDGFLSMRNANEIDPRDLNYTQVIQNSLVTKALAKYDKIPLSNNKIQNLRLQAEINCGEQLAVPCNPQAEECLFDIGQDPCEKTNLANNSQYKEILDEIRKRLNELKKTVIPPYTGGANIRNDPTRHDCTWTYYLEEPKTSEFLGCGYDSPPCQS